MTAHLSPEDRERVASCVWGIGTRTRSPLLPLLLAEVASIAARAWEEGAMWAAEECGAVSEGAHPSSWLGPDDNPYRTP